MSQKLLKTISRRTFIGLVMVFALAPLVWGVLTSLKSSDAILQSPPQWIPSPITFDHYIAVFTTSNLPLYMMNSLIVAGAATVLALAVATYGAYAAARLRFRGKSTVLMVVLMTSMVPGIAVLIPLYALAVKIGLYDSHLVLVLVFAAWQMPMAMWIIRGFIEALPLELEQAAAVDGCSRIGAFHRVVLPNLRAGMGAASLIVFLFVWNDWLIASILVNSRDKTLLQVGLFQFVADTGVQWGQFMAYAVASSIPVIILFILLERSFVRGLTSGATKG
ncbi:carbohydrate ABC transporter permease [Arthrobacter sp. CDRTa11]|uniref:carbohydrate ABC transporter permease n=1 Tax=Arthrobacter sp. CDRTa11 TaxID=2651199 RepID=UPI002265E4C0|nr:carbohydrate ABC transporter permease [Arthrobacter sp. CDRTa11]UZX01245.1 carbohydrate ABC transporter permease [Arthrobacter sp. CDRTa11]